MFDFANLRIFPCLFTKNQDQIPKLRAFTHLEIKKTDSFNVDGYCHHCKTVFEAMICYYNFCPCQETCPSLSDKDFERSSKRRESDDLRQEYIREKR